MTLKGGESFLHITIYYISLIASYHFWLMGSDIASLTHLDTMSGHIESEKWQSFVFLSFFPYLECYSLLTQTPTFTKKNICQ